MAITKEQAIKEATKNAEEWYICEEDPDPSIEFKDAELQEDGEWLVFFEVYGWLVSEWRVWEYKGEITSDIIGG